MQCKSVCTKPGIFIPIQIISDANQASSAFFKEQVRQHLLEVIH